MDPSVSLKDCNSKIALSGRRVAYIAGDKYVQICDQLPKVTGRASRVHGLIEAFGLLQYMSVVVPTSAADSDLRLFHSPEYLNCLQTINAANDNEEISEEVKEFGLAYDCPIFDNLYECVSYVAGGSLAAAECLLSGRADVAINWSGGWHHAKRDEAAGFCYINDIVVAILRLRQKYSRILYVDLDLHHGDGVEDAFCATGKVMTVSFHKYSPGFFPGSGSVSDVGIGKGKYFGVNVPLGDGIDDQMYLSIFTRVISAVQQYYQSEVIVCQCGADTLAGDPLACFNLTPDGIWKCVQYLINFNIPLLLVGGGGYNFVNTACCWTLLTAGVVGVTLPSDIPEHQYFTEYGPGFDLDVSPSFIRNSNKAEDVENIISVILGNLARIQTDS